MAIQYDNFVRKMQKIADINSAIAVLHWDQETYLPEGSAIARGKQIATLSVMVHQEFIGTEMGRIMRAVRGLSSLTAKQKRNVEIIDKEFKKAKKFSEEFVLRRSMAVSTAFQSWVNAKNKSDFSLFESALNELITIKREESVLLGKSKHPYDNLLDMYEPGATVEQLDALFEDVKTKLLPIIAKIRARDTPKRNFLYKKYDKEKQWDFGIYLLKAIGYDFNKGRQDISSHPFTIGFSPDDVRVTTRIDEHDFSNMTWSCIHEGGHALYEQGLDPLEYGLPSGGAISLAIHESQSRLWENQVGRSMDFWQFHYPSMQKTFKPLRKVSLKNFYKAINVIKPNLVRTEGDELHYHIHVLIRYEIEKEIIAGHIDAQGARGLWNKKYKDYLGIDITDDAQGILQDVHWSHGSFGYFPTYSMGSFYAAQFFAKATKDIPDLQLEIARGNTHLLLDWLRSKIHIHGRSLEAEELCKKVTGKPLSMKYFVDYAKNKYGDLYNMKL